MKGTTTTKANVPQERRASRQVTSIAFTAQDLLALARLVGAGQVLLGTSHPVVSRLKAALSRLGLSLHLGL